MNTSTRIAAETLIHYWANAEVQAMSRQVARPEPPPRGKPVLRLIKGGLHKSGAKPHANR